MNCPACGAHNPDSAAWCGQCLTDFRPPPQPVVEIELPAAEFEAPSPTQPLEMPSTDMSVAASASASGFAIPVVVDAGSGAGESTVTAPAATDDFRPSSPPIDQPLDQPPPVPATPPPVPAKPSPAPATPPPTVVTQANPAPPPLAASAGYGDGTTPVLVGSHSVRGATTQIPAPPSPVGQSTRGLRSSSGIAANSMVGIAKDATGALTWNCSVCSAQNSIDLIDCATCGASMFAAYRDAEEARSRPTVSPDAALTWGLIPGGGQWVANRRGQAVGRALLVLWLVGCAVILRDKSMMWLRVVNGLGAMGVWAVSAFDARAMVSGRESAALLTPKRMTLVLVTSIALLLALSIILAGKVNQMNKDQQEKPGPTSETPAGPPPGGGSGNGDSGGTSGGAT